eukprot:905008_1
MLTISVVYIIHHMPFQFLFHLFCSEGNEGNVIGVCHFFEINNLYVVFSKLIQSNIIPKSSPLTVYDKVASTAFSSILIISPVRIACTVCVSDRNVHKVGCDKASNDTIRTRRITTNGKQINIKIPMFDHIQY